MLAQTIRKVGISGAMYKLRFHDGFIHGISKRERYEYAYASGFYWQVLWHKRTHSRNTRLPRVVEALTDLGVQVPEYFMLARHHVVVFKEIPEEPRVRDVINVAQMKKDEAKEKAKATRLRKAEQERQEDLNRRNMLAMGQLSSTLAELENLLEVCSFYGIGAKK